MEQPIIYRDKSGVIEGTLINRFDPDYSGQSPPLVITLAGVAFEGYTYTGLEPVLDDKEEPGLARFEFTKYGVFDTSAYHLELVNYELEFKLEVKLVKKGSGQVLTFPCICTIDKQAKYDKITLQLNLDSDELTCSSDSFEGLFDLVIEELHPFYYLKNCYGCAYSDYSPYGTDSFGTIMCFRNCKSAYGKIKSKADYFQVLGLNQAITVQETYLCNQFTERIKGTGYRG